MNGKCNCHFLSGLVPEKNGPLCVSLQKEGLISIFKRTYSDAMCTIPHPHSHVKIYPLKGSKNCQQIEVAGSRYSVLISNFKYRKNEKRYGVQLSKTYGENCYVRETFDDSYCRNPYLTSTEVFSLSSFNELPKSSRRPRRCTSSFSSYENVFSCSQYQTLQKMKEKNIFSILLFLLLISYGVYKLIISNNNKQQTTNTEKKETQTSNTEKKKIEKKILFEKPKKKVLFEKKKKIVDVIPEKKRENKKLNFICRELLSTEKSYVEHLKLTEVKYILPLMKIQPTMFPQSTEKRTKSFGGGGSFVDGKGDGGPDGGDEYVRRLFLSFRRLQNIQKINSVFLGDLKGVISMEDDNTENIHRLASVLTRFSQTFKLYGDFISDFENLSQSVSVLLKKNKNFAAFCTAVHSQLKGQGHRITQLNSLLITPVQRIPRLGLLIRDLMKCVGGPGTEEGQRLEKAYDLVNETSQFCNDKTEERILTARLRELVDELKMPELIQSFRRLLREELISEVLPDKKKNNNNNKKKKKEKTRLVRFILLSDLCIVFPVKKKKSAKKKIIFELTDRQTAIQSTAGEEDAFEMMGQKKNEEKRIKLKFESPAKCEEVKKAVQEQIQMKRVNNNYNNN